MVGLLPTYHWYVSGAVPVATTVIVAVAPEVIVWLCGCVVMMAAVGVAAAEASLTLNVWPAIRSVPCRASPGLACTVNATAPDPIPVAAPAILTQGTSASAVQAQLPAVVTAVLPVPPFPGNEALVGEIAKEQGGGAFGRDAA